MNKKTINDRKYWMIHFVLCEVAVFGVALMFYGAVGPLAVVLWSVAAFSFGAMWATGRATE
jgi:hypothetical protein